MCSTLHVRVVALISSCVCPRAALGDDPFGNPAGDSPPERARSQSNSVRRRKSTKVSTINGDDDLETGLLHAAAGAGVGVAGMFSTHLVPEDIASAARTGNAAHFIGELDHGYQTRVRAAVASPKHVQGALFCA